jgi:hypothetical protein
MNRAARITRGRKMAKPVFDIKDIPEESLSLEDKGLNTCNLFA